MESTVVVAILSLVGTLGGSIIAGIVSNNKTLYRIEQFCLQYTNKRRYVIC